MASVSYEKDQHNIVHLILDKPNASTNLMDNEFCQSFVKAVTQLRTEDYIGVIIRSTKSTFFAGGNLDELYQVTTDNADALYNMLDAMKCAMRELEISGKPVVACINGAALGGGLELALACHYRVAVAKGVILGFPEVSLGLLPGAGGTIRLSRLLGLQVALPYLAEGKKFTPQQGKSLKLIDDIVNTSKELLSSAIDWIKTNPQVKQPYDIKGYKVPGGIPSDPALAQMLPIAPTIIRSQTRGNLPAPEYMLAAMVEGLQVDIDSAMRIESRYFVSLVCHPVAKNMIGTLWYQLNEIKAGAARPDDIACSTIKKVGIIGAGMMGAGIAYSSAAKGINVILTDISLDKAKAGKAYTEKVLSKKVLKGQLTIEKSQAINDTITASESLSDLHDCDLVIEAVFESRELKAQITGKSEKQLSENAVFASNTSTLPITGLAEASTRPENFIGLHFFSPVDKMPIVEIICGQKTSVQTLAKAYDYVLQIGKTPIVVNDSRGFFTSRVFSTFTHEGIAMLAEGIPAAAIENAAFLAGFPVGPLAVTDEVSLTLLEKIRVQTIKDLQAEGKEVPSHPADAVIDKMLNKQRTGKLDKAGFYQYPETGKKSLWPALNQLFPQTEQEIDIEKLKDRLLYIQALETLRCLNEQVLTSVRDANIGSIMAIGYPTWTGGAVQFINQTGLSQFILRAESLCQEFGSRFSVPANLKEMAENGLTFTDKKSPK